MIFGNPDKFAIYIDVVDQWCNLPSHIEGVAALYVKEKYIIGDLRSTSIYNIISDIKNGALNNVQYVEKIFFSQSSTFIVKELLKKRYPTFAFDSDEEYAKYSDYLYESEDMLFDANIEIIDSYDYKLFVIGCEELARIFCVKFSSNNHDYFNLSLINESLISDIYISQLDIRKIISSIDDWCLNLYNPT